MDPTLGLSRGWFEPHPYTIASAPNGLGLRVMVGAGGDFTRELREAAVTMLARDRVRNPSVETADVEVVVEGPYGGLTHIEAADFSTCLLLAGGSGATFILAMAEHILQRIAEGNSNVRVLKIVWSARSQETFLAFKEHFERILCEAKETDLHVSCNLHLTSPKSLEGSDGKESSPIDGTKLNYYRADLNKALSTTLGLSQRAQATEGILVLSCGPPRFIQGVRRTVAAADQTKAQKLGGIVLHTETFGW